jgi:hypothetical protein
VFPKPTYGLVIRYSYLWLEQHRRGMEEGVKDRPCAIILTVTDKGGNPVVTVLPITYTPPATGQAHLAIEIPFATKRRLGLDESRSWIVLTEANCFVWPGPDLRLIRTGDAASVAYGLLPAAFYDKVRLAFIDVIRSGAMTSVWRTE